jgi:energy-coupling factor transport system permease protein
MDTNTTVVSLVPHLSTPVVNLVSWLVLVFGISAPLALIFVLIGLRGFREVTKYDAHTTFLYRASPITKLVFVISCTVIAAITIWWISAALTVIVLGLYTTLKNGRRKLVVGLYLFITSLVGVAWGVAPYTPLNVLGQAFNTDTFHAIWIWPGYFSVMGYLPVLTLEALVYGVQVAFRFIPASLAGLLLIMTTTPSDLLRYLHRIRFPLPVIFALMVAIRTIPRIFEIFDSVMKLQFMRGLGAGKPRVAYPAYVLEAAVMAVVPTIIYLMRGAKYTAIAADTRGFMAYKTRSYLKETRLTQLDYKILGAIALMYASAAILIYLGMGRGIPYTGF